MNPGISRELLERVVELRRGARATYSEIHLAVPEVSYSTIVKLCQGKSRKALFDSIAKELGYG